MFVFIVWVLVSVLVGKYADSKGLSFWGHVILSLAFSPIIGFLIAAISDRKDI